MEFYRFIRFGAAALAIAVATPAVAQDWPGQSISLIVPFSPGGLLDTTTRVIAEGLSADLGTSVIVENVPGGGTMIATSQVANATPDGSRFLIAASAFTINPAIQTTPYDPVADFKPVTLAISPIHVLIVREDLPIRSVAELIAYAKERPGELSYGSVGYGTSTHIEAELLANKTDVEFLHVPYPGSAQALQDLIGGRIDFMFDAYTSSKPFIESGSVRLLGVTSAERSPIIPDAPTIAESGVPGYVAVPWSGFLAPAGVSDEIVNAFNDALQEVLAKEEVKTRFSDIGVEILSYGPQEFADFITADLGTWKAVAEAAGLEKVN